MEPVEEVRVEINAEFVGDGGDVEEGIGGAGDGGMDHDGILKGFPGDDVPGAKALLCKLQDPAARRLCHVPKVGAHGGHQGRAGKHQAQSLTHDLHGGGGSHKAAGTAGGTGMVLVPGELVIGDLPTGGLGGIDADLLQGQQVGTGVHDTAGDQNGGHVDAADGHEVGGDRLVAAGESF